MQLKGAVLSFAITKRLGNTVSTVFGNTVSGSVDESVPASSFVNLLLSAQLANQVEMSRGAMLLLENPKGDVPFSSKEIEEQVSVCVIQLL